MSWDDTLVIEVKISPYAERDGRAMNHYRQSARESLLRKISDHIGTNSTNIQFDERILERGYYGDTVLQIRARLGEVRQMEVALMPLPIIEWSNGKHRCNHCGGNTIDDTRGNCSACGAPRRQ